MTDVVFDDDGRPGVGVGNAPAQRDQVTGPGDKTDEGVAHEPLGVRIFAAAGDGIGERPGEQILMPAGYSLRRARSPDGR
jgi:hypothetical protein